MNPSFRRYAGRLHVHHSHEHGAQLEEVVVLGVLHLHHAPGVQATPHLLPLSLDLLVGPHHRKRYAGLEGGACGSKRRR